jgi:uncharacterized protein
MKEKVLKVVMRELLELQQKNMRIIWHGGEPTLTGIGFYKKMLDIQNSLITEGNSINHSIQTNGVRINQKWADFFKENDFRVGISIDGPEDIHDSQRKLLNGKGTFDKVLRAVSILQSTEVPLGVVCVVTKRSLRDPGKMLDFFCDNRIFNINFLPTGDFNTGGKLTDYSLTPEEWGYFLIEVFDKWISKDDPRVKIQILNSFLQGLIGGVPNLCVCKKDCTNFISINNDGRVFFCGRFMGNDEFFLGDIIKQKMCDIINGESLLGLSENISSIKQECLNCEWLNICNGGCPNHRYFPDKNVSSPYYFCKSTKMILNHMSLVLPQYLHP